MSRWLLNSKRAVQEIGHFPIYDLDGEVGRSASRNFGVKKAFESGYDWLFFLDADDIMFEDAFDAFTGLLILTTQFGAKLLRLSPTN